MVTKPESMTKRLAYFKEKYQLDLDALVSGNPGTRLHSIDELVSAAFREGAVWEHAQEQRFRNL